MGLHGAIDAAFGDEESRPPDFAEKVLAGECATGIVDEAGEQAKGLMFREDLAADEGMLFDIGETRIVTMWMKNTLIPLSVAFLDSEGRILNIEDMEPHSEQPHSSTSFAKYALEMNQGWFAARAIREGEQVSGLKRLPQPK